MTATRDAVDTAPPTPPRKPRRTLRQILLSRDGWPYILVPFIPIALAFELAGGSHALIFATSACGVIPMAALMGRATEELADRAGPGHRPAQRRVDLARRAAAARPLRCARPDVLLRLTS
jgi:hypothetical protein